MQPRHLRNDELQYMKFSFLSLNTNYFFISFFLSGKKPNSALRSYPLIAICGIHSEQPSAGEVGGKAAHIITLVDRYSRQDAAATANEEIAE